LFEKHRYLVDGWHVTDNKDLFVLDLAKVGDLLDSGGFKFALAAAGNLVLSVIQSNG